MPIDCQSKERPNTHWFQKPVVWKSHVFFCFFDNHAAKNFTAFAILLQTKFCARVCQNIVYKKHATRKTPFSKKTRFFLNPSLPACVGSRISNRQSWTSWVWSYDLEWQACHSWQTQLSLVLSFYFLPQERWQRLAKILTVKKWETPWQCSWRCNNRMSHTMTFVWLGGRNSMHAPRDKYCASCQSVLSLLSDQESVCYNR